MTPADEADKRREGADVEMCIEGLDELRRVSAEIAGHAKRSIDLLSRELNPLLYDQHLFLAYLKRFALSSHQSSVRILLCDNTRVQREGHRLVELVRQFPSNMEIRRPPEEHRQQYEEVLIADRSSYCRCGHGDRNLGFAGYGDRPRAEQLARRFVEIWQQSSVESELRRLYL